MSVKSCEKLEKSQVALTVEVGAAEFQAAIEKAYQKMRKKINVPGFRPGKAPRKVIEGMYGAEVFFEEAINIAFPDAYEAAVKEQELQVVGYPTVELVGECTKDGFTFKATAPVYPEVTLGQYKELSAPKDEVKVTAADVDERLKELSDRNTRLVSVDREAKEGDTVVIDFEGFLDGKPFDGGKGENHSLELGSHSFVPGFEEQLIGKNIGDEVEVNVTFPAEYHAAELAGKPAVFKVKIHEIKTKELPELNDEFAGEVSEFETMDEYKSDIRAKLAETKQQQATTENENNVVEKVVENASMEIPDAMIDEQVREMINDYARRMQSQGISLEQYMQFTGMTIEKLQEQSRPQAEKRIRTRLVLEAVVAAENIQVSDEAVDAEIAKMAETYKMEADKVRSIMGEAGIAQMKEDMAVQEAVDFLVAEANLI